VITGMHHMFLAVDLQLISTQGGTFIWPMIVMSNLAQGSAALAVFTMSRNARDRSMASTSAISAYFGITGAGDVRRQPALQVSVLCRAGRFGPGQHLPVAEQGPGLGHRLPGFISIIPQYIPMFVIGMVVALVVPFA
jgi:PTS system trehalose-specific IIC component